MCHLSTLIFDRCLGEFALYQSSPDIQPYIASNPETSPYIAYSPLTPLPPQTMGEDWAPPFDSADLLMTPPPYGDLHATSPFVATPQAAIDLLLEGLQLTEEDYLVDLGCGQGAINITAAARFGARGLGVDIEPSLVEEAGRAAEEAGVAARLEWRVEDVLETDLTQATAITSFLVPRQLRQVQASPLQPSSPGAAQAAAVPG